ncbi:MAG: TIGR02281 family clan AA aspartic protease [Pseudomonadota bacterium]
MKPRELVLSLLLALPLPSALAAVEFEVVALFTNTAVLRFGSEQKMLKAGQSFRGVTLIAADAKQATLEIDGQLQVVGVSRRVSANYSEPESREIRLRRNANLQYITRARVNGRSTDVLVDTGANVMVLNTVQAQGLGVDYANGRPSQVKTASDMVPAWLVELESVELGGIRINAVEAAVLEGNFPEHILLGMSFLKHVEISERDGTMTLSREW